MAFSRRGLLKGLCSLPMLSLSSLNASGETTPSTPMLPDTRSFSFRGVYLDAAYTHPMSAAARNAYHEFLQHRSVIDQRIGPGRNSRDVAVARFAKLINASANDVAVVPSTMEGENLVAAALGLNEKSAIVTDALHYDASLVMYRELAKRGIQVTVVAAKGGGIDFGDMERAIGNSTRLVAISLVSNVSGFQHDLKAVCELAHSKSALVYADIIQAAGAVPLDVKNSGVDFCGCGSYKWLMGDFGTAFLYVRPDRLGELRRVQVGWRQIRSQPDDLFPVHRPNEEAGEATLRSDAAGMFEVSTPAWGALACVAGSLAYIDAVGVDAIVRHRKPLMNYLTAELPKLGFELLTPAGSAGPIIAFGYNGAARFAKPLKEAGIQISVYENRIRVSPSVYNDMEDVEKLRHVLSNAI